MIKKNYWEYDHIEYTFTLEFNKNDKSIEVYLDDFGRKILMEDTENFSADKVNLMRDIDYFCPDWGGEYYQLTNTPQGKDTIMAYRFKVYMWFKSKEDHDHKISFDFEESENTAYLDLNDSIGRDNFLIFLKSLPIPSVTTLTIGEPPDLLSEISSLRCPRTHEILPQNICKVTFFMLERPE
jgi:hypothetical protein